jgi:hypothetical protein
VPVKAADGKSVLLKQRSFTARCVRGEKNQEHYPINQRHWNEKQTQFRQQVNCCFKARGRLTLHTAKPLNIRGLKDDRVPSIERLALPAPGTLTLR